MVAECSKIRKHFYAFNISFILETKPPLVRFCAIYESYIVDSFKYLINYAICCSTISPISFDKLSYSFDKLLQYPFDRLLIFMR